MRTCCCVENPILASVKCEEIFSGTTGAIIGIVGAVASAVGTGISLIAQQSAAQQAAANAQAIANYNARIQEVNAQTAYQIQVQQAEYTAQAARANQQLALFNQRSAEAQAESQKRFFEYSKSVSLANAAAAQQRYEAQLQQAKALGEQGEAERAKSREEARRLREENERRISQIRGKYAASGVSFEGSPLVVLSDAARLAETAVQDLVYVGELEARKQFRAGELQKFEAGFTLLEKANFEAEAFAAETQSFSAQNLAASKAYESQILALNYENQILAATYDTYIADAERKAALNQASLTRMGGEAQASNIRSASTASLLGGIANLGSSISSAGYRASTAFPKTTTGTLR